MSKFDMVLPEKQERTDLMAEIGKMNAEMDDLDFEFEELELELEDLNHLLEDSELPELVTEKKEKKAIDIDCDMNKCSLKGDKVGEKFDKLSNDISKQTLNVFGTLTNTDANDWENQACAIIGKGSDNVKVSSRSTLAQVGELPTLNFDSGDSDLTNLLESKFLE